MKKCDKCKLEMAVIRTVKEVVDGVEKEKSKEVSAGGKSEHQKSAGVHPHLSLHTR